MPLLTTVIDDKSPLITYDATWLPGTSLNDNLAVDYYLGTFQKNSVGGGTATFSFNGTTVWIYGANRPNHGTYTVQVDSNTFPPVNGSGNNLFQQSLFTTSVGQGLHTVKLVNTGATGFYVDIDMVVWQSEVGKAGDQLATELVQDVDPRFQYQQSAWTTASSASNLNLNLFNNGTGHITPATDATVSFTFIVCPFLISHYREAVTLFGTAGPSNGPYSVQLDGGQTIQYNATNAYPTSYGIPIYHADNLGSGSHQILLANLPDTSAQYLAIDYAQVWTVANSTSSGASPSVTPCAPSNLFSSHNISSGVIAGLVIEGVVAILAAAAATFFYWRWKTASSSQSTYYTPVFRSPATTTVTASGIAPSVETRSNPSSVVANTTTTFQPLAAVGKLRRLSGSGGAAPTRATLVSESTNPPALVPNFEGQAPGRRPLPDTPGGVGSRGDADQILSDAPPGYETAVHGGA